MKKEIPTGNKNFSTGKVRGALSDQGKAFILLGPPYRVSGRGGNQSAGTYTGVTAPTDANGEITVARPTAESPTQQRKLVGMISRPMVEPVDCRARFPTGAIGDSNKISLVDLFGLGEFAWLAFRYHPALG